MTAPRASSDYFQQNWEDPQTSEKIKNVQVKAQDCSPKHPSHSFLLHLEAQWAHTFLSKFNYAVSFKNETIG